MGGGLMQLVAYGAQDIYLTGNPQITFFKVVYRRHTNFAVEPIAQTFNGQADFGKCASATISRNGDLITCMYLQAVLPKISTDTVAVVDAQGAASDPACVQPCLLGVDGKEINAQDILAIAATQACGVDATSANECQANAIRAAASRGHAHWVSNVGYAMIDTVSVEIGGQKIDRHDGRWMQIWHELSGSDEKQYGHDRMVGNMPELVDPVSLLGQASSSPWFLLNKDSDCSESKTLPSSSSCILVL